MTNLNFIWNNFILFFIRKINFRMAWIKNSILTRQFNRILMLAIATKTGIMNNPIGPSYLFFLLCIRFTNLFFRSTQRYVQIKFICLFRNWRHQSFVVTLFGYIFWNQWLAKWCALHTYLTINRSTLLIIFYIYSRIYLNIEIRVIMLFFKRPWFLVLIKFAF